MHHGKTFCLCALLSAGSLLFAKAQVDSTRQTELPKVVLLGDSIRMGYAPLVAKRLAGKARIVSTTANAEDSGNVLRNLEDWVISEKPALVHFNCGLHDLKLSRERKQYQVDLGQYQKNLKQIVDRIRDATSAAVVFANTTPILDVRHAKRGVGFDRFEADVERYNTAALTVMREADIPVNDLHWIIQRAGMEEMLGSDGTHYTPAGYERLADAVADCILRQLKVAGYQPLPSPPAGPQAAANYVKMQAERDALVPPVYKLSVKDFSIPHSAAEWHSRRLEILKTTAQSLGDLPSRPKSPRVRRISRELRREYSLEKVGIDNGVDGEITALLLIPERRHHPAPAILWLHSSTPDKTQIITPNSNGGAEPLGETLVRSGYVVLAPDAYWHGDRAGTGPAGAAETSRAEQESLFKLNLWLGRTLWGMFVRDDQIALDYLYSRPEVDQKRIGATGMSMGSTRAWWLAALDERIAALVGVACLTRYQNLIAHGELRQHGVYYFVDGLLRHFDTEGVVALVAPRPFLALTGELDAGSPADGVKVIEKKVAAVYAALGAPEKFRSVLYPEVGHSYTPQMRAETLAWFDRWLQSNKNR
ncbi:MAG TPA: GDSL-type esterase/lipase family protein [Acidobacteriota bacterium]